MNPSLKALLLELERFGVQNDAARDDYSERMLNITHDTGEFLSVLVHATGARRILEIGTSNGYSTLWLAQATSSNGGHVTTVESSAYKVELARQNFERSGLAAYITLLHRDASEALQDFPEGSIDLLFLDTNRNKYTAWWPHLRLILRPGGLLVADNAVSHAEQMRPFVSLVNEERLFTTSTVPVGNGEFLAVKVGP